MDSNLVVESGMTEMGARKLAPTESGAEFRKDGLLWWASLGLFQKLKILVTG